VWRFALTTKLFDVLLRFRAHKVAFIGDLEKAFLQIEMDEGQLDRLRFLWFKNPAEIDFENFENNELVELRLTRVLFGATPLPFLLSATLQHHAEKYRDIDPGFVQKLLESMHVDDLTGGDSNVQKSFEFISKAKEIF